MTQFRARLKDGTTVEIEADSVGKYQDQFLAFEVEVTKSKTVVLDGGMFSAAKLGEITYTEKQWAGLIPLAEIVFVAPASVFAAPATGSEGGQ
jgi:hypothetical protein